MRAVTGDAGGGGGVPKSPLTSPTHSASVLSSPRPPGLGQAPTRIPRPQHDWRAHPHPAILLWPLKVAGGSGLELGAEETAGRPPPAQAACPLLTAGGGGGPGVGVGAGGRERGLAAGGGASGGRGPRPGGRGRQGGG